MPNNFDEARTATEEMFADDSQLSLEDAVEQETEPQTEETTETVEDVPAEAVEQVTPESAILDDAVNTAELAAQTAQQKDAELQQALQQIEALRQQNQEMQGTISELSAQNEQNLIEEAMQPPTLDINGLAFADEATIAQAQAEFAQKMSEYNRKEFEKEYAPVLAYAQKGMQEEERANTLNVLSQLPELQGINDMMPQLDRIIANNRWLQSDDMSMEEKLVNAYAIARGVNAINTPPEPEKKLTDDDLMKLYDENPTFQELIEKKRIEAIKNSQQVPPFSASSGAVNAALNIKEKPKTFEEAAERTRKMFGLA